jgi:hypothetical protein
MTEAEKREILRQARANVAADFRHLDRTPPAEDVLIYRVHEMPQPEPPPPEQKLDIAPVTWGAMFAHIDARIAAERQRLVEGVGAGIVDLLDEQRAEHRADLDLEVRQLRIELQTLTDIINELRRALAASERSRAVLDLTPLPSRTPIIN